MSSTRQVLYLYEFTLLSNSLSLHTNPLQVLYLYEFTLLSNGDDETVKEN